MLRHLFTKFNAPKSSQIPPGYFMNSFELNSDQEFIKVVPIGKFPNHHNGAHVIEIRQIEEMAANLKAGGTDILFDFGHESIWSPGARAAGWSPKDDVEVRADGLYIRYPSWTKSGKKAVENADYRYLSPTYRLATEDKEGRQVGAKLHSVALTNRPYMDVEIDHIGNSEVSPMYSKEFLNSLGLQEGATEEQVLAKIEELKANAKPSKPQEPETPEPNTDQPESSNDPVLVELQKINGRLDGLESAQVAGREAEIEAILNAAVADFRILPADKPTWKIALNSNFEEQKAALHSKPKGSTKPGSLTVKPGEDKGEKVNSFDAAVAALKSIGRYPHHNQVN